MRWIRRNKNSSLRMPRCTPITYSRRINNYYIFCSQPIFHILLEPQNVTQILQIKYKIIFCAHKNWQKFQRCLSILKNYVFQLIFFWTDSDFFAGVASSRFHLILFESHPLFYSWPLNKTLCNLKIIFFSLMSALWEN